MQLLSKSADDVKQQERDNASEQRSSWQVSLLSC